MAAAVSRTRIEANDSPAQSPELALTLTRAKPTFPHLEHDLDRLRFHLIGDVFCLPDRQGHNCERRIFGATRRELASVRHKQVLDVVRLAPFVDNPVSGIGAHAVGAEIVRRRIGGRWKGAADKAAV